jgi:hypothetical protein
VQTAARTRAALSAAVAAAALATGVSCAEEPRAIDPFPIRFDPSLGPVVLAVEAGQGTVPAVLDTLSAVTLLDPVATGGAAGPAHRRRVVLTLFGLDRAGNATIARARFPDSTVIVYHPCPGEGPCPIGLEGQTVEVGAVLGADLLGRSAMRIDFPAQEIRFFPETPGTEAELSNECHAVVPGVFGGGGTLLVSGTEVNFVGRRPVLGACLDVAGADDDVERGTDALLLVSTGTGVSVLSASAYDRYARAAGAPGRSALPVAVLQLPSGPAEVRLGQVGRMALLGRLTEEGSERGACRELHLNRLMSEGACEDPERNLRACPCPDGDTFCRTAAAVDLDGPVDVAILADSHPLLQSLRDELRPQHAEVDGLIGTSALAPLRVEFDYPNGRLVMRCRAGGCTTRPAVRSRASVQIFEHCQAAEEDLGADAGPGGADAGVADGGVPGAAHGDASGGGASDGGPG